MNTTPYDPGEMAQWVGALATRPEFELMRENCLHAHRYLVTHKVRKLLICALTGLEGSACGPAGRVPVQHAPNPGAQSCITEILCLRVAQ